VHCAGPGRASQARRLRLAVNRRLPTAHRGRSGVLQEAGCCRSFRELLGPCASWTLQRLRPSWWSGSSSTRADAPDVSFRMHYRPDEREPSLGRARRSMAAFSARATWPRALVSTRLVAMISAATCLGGPAKGGELLHSVLHGFAAGVCNPLRMQGSVLHRLHH
jgi:hypothetical protein